MDVNKVNQLRILAEQQTKTANHYAIIRKEAGEAETDLKIILTSKLKEIRENKKGVGIDMAILMLCEDDIDARNLFNKWMKKEAEYKGIEKILEAQSSQLIFEQSLMKFQIQGEKYS